VTVQGRLTACLVTWPDCEEGAYDPRCCRFPKSCSCTSNTSPSITVTTFTDIEGHDWDAYDALEKVVLEGFSAYWWLGERAANQLAAAALTALNRAGVLYWSGSPKQAPPDRAGLSHD
jgi:hypothetical protein